MIQQILSLRQYLLYHIHAMPIISRTRLHLTESIERLEWVVSSLDSVAPEHRTQTADLRRRALTLLTIARIVAKSFELREEGAPG
jgi:hypothetical protein